MSEVKQGTLREVMPETAAIVDWLRTELGTERADKLLLKGKQGKGGFWARETGPDGQVREFGSRNITTKWPEPNHGA